MFDAALSQMDWRPTQAALMLAAAGWIAIRALLAWGERTRVTRTLERIAAQARATSQDG